MYKIPDYSPDKITIFSRGQGLKFWPGNSPNLFSNFGWGLKGSGAVILAGAPVKHCIGQYNSLFFKWPILINDMGRYFLIKLEIEVAAGHD